jgi:hypothetical protein
MWAYLIPAAGLAALCAAWVLFQQWLARVDPEQGDCVMKRCGCGGCGRSNPKESD